MGKIKPTNKKIRAVISIFCAMACIGGFALMLASLRYGWIAFVSSLSIIGTAGSLIAFINVGEEEIISM